MWHTISIKNNYSPSWRKYIYLNGRDVALNLTFAITVGTKQERGRKTVSHQPAPDPSVRGRPRSQKGCGAAERILNPFPDQTPNTTEGIREGAGPRRDLSTREGQFARWYRGASRPSAGGLMAGQRSLETVERSPFESRSTVGAGDSFEVSRASRRRMPAEALWVTARRTTAEQRI